MLQAVTTGPAANAHGRRDVERLLATALALAVAWNLIGNLVLPGEWYVPANLAVAAVLLVLGRRAGLGWDELGLRRDRVLRGLLVGAGALLLVAVVLLVALSLPSFDGMLESDQVSGDSRFDHWFVPLVRIPPGTAGGGQPGGAGARAHGDQQPGVRRGADRPRPDLIALPEAAPAPHRSRMASIIPSSIAAR